jgi:hypothetical protein
MELTQDQLKELLHYDPETGIFRWRFGNGRNVKPWDIAGGDNGLGYIKIRVLKTRISAHRLAWLYITGKLPKHEVDHKDGIRSNNAWGNLREATRKQNMENRYLNKNNTSGFTGVTWNAKQQRWAASIGHNKKLIHLGSFKTAEEAAKVAADKRSELHTHYTGRDQVNTFG